MVENKEKGEKSVMVIMDIKIMELGNEIGLKIGNNKKINGGDEEENDG
jgi:hypothetical protein